MSVPPRMQWSHMTNAEAMALRQLLAQLETPRQRQYWSRAQTHEDDWTCVVAEPTGLEVQAIAALMKGSL